MGDIYHAITVTPLPGKEAGFPDFALFEQVAQDQLEPYLIEFTVDRSTNPETGLPEDFSVSGWSSYDRSLRFAEWLQVTSETYPVRIVFELEFNDGEGNLNSRDTWVGGKRVRQEEARMTDVTLDKAIKQAQDALDFRGHEYDRPEVLTTALSNLLSVLS